LHNDDAGVKRGTLYVVATPIGNLRDVTLRALDVLRDVDLIAAEDTRQTRKLLARYGIATRTVSVHEHNEPEAAQQIAGLLASGKAVGLVTDAGTPGLSDPGARVVAIARAQGFAVVPVPGPSSLTAALSVSGMEGQRFVFAGFLPARAGERRKQLAALAGVADTTVFFEAPHRIDETLVDMTRAFGGERRIVLARELTKLFEEVHECALSDAGAWIRGKQQRTRGEFVLVLSGAPDQPADGLPDAAERALRVLVDELPVNQAARLAAAITGEKKGELYRRALELKATQSAKRETTRPEGAD
jgi:16S rRNA (cytidine1402-2'-O)-methyltransferase